MTQPDATQRVTMEVTRTDDVITFNIDGLPAKTLRPGDTLTIDLGRPLTVIWPLEPPPPDLDLRTSEQWAALVGYRVIDPDGWLPDCRLGAKDWNEKITFEEFLIRAADSYTERYSRYTRETP